MRTITLAALATAATLAGTGLAAAAPVVLADVPFGWAHSCLGPNALCDTTMPAGAASHLFAVEGATLFEGVTYGPGTLPFTAYADSGNDPDFAPVAGYLSNAIADDFSASYTLAPFGGGGGFGGEDLLLFGTDFAGFTIVRIGLQFNSMTITDTADGWEAITDARLLVEGEATVVPEPSTVWLVGAGVGAVLARRRRRP